MLTEELYAVPYRSLSDLAESHDKYNVVIGMLYLCCIVFLTVCLAIYTTSYARSILFKYMKEVAMAPSHKLLYTGIYYTHHHHHIDT